MNPALPDRLPTELEACIATCRASSANSDIRVRRERPTRASTWVAGISVASLAAAGIVATVRSIADSDANTPVAGTPSAYSPAPTDPGDAYPRAAQTQAVTARNAPGPGNRSSCPECGVVESIRQIEDAGDAGVQGAVNARVGRGASGAESVGDATPTNATTGQSYEIKVRFRDGSTTVFSKSSPQTWRLGSPVIVIGRFTTPNN